MSSVVTEFPDQTYTTSNKPSVETLKSDISALETGHNDLETTAMKLAGTQTVTGQKTFGSGLLVATAPVIRAWDGWNAVADTWTYASATTITVPTGAASLYSVGDKIKLTQTTTKYFYVVAVADTVLTITGGSDYTLANAAITSPYVAHTANPVGFPQWFNYTPTGPTNTTMTGRFTVNGRTCRVIAKGEMTGAPSFASMPSRPITASASLMEGGTYYFTGNGGYLDNGTSNNPNTIVVRTTQSSTALDLYRDIANPTALTNTSPITWASGDIWMVEDTYEI